MPKVTIRASGLIILMLIGMSAGCLGSGEEDYEEGSLVDLVVYYDSTNATIMEIHNNGQQTSRDGAEFSFDFRETHSDNGDIVTFSFTPGDGTDTVSIDAAENSVLTYAYQTHGIFEATLMAEDDDNNTASQDLTLRVDLHHRDSQTGTQNPSDATIDLAPDDDSLEFPAQLKLKSTVENPDSPFFSDTVQVTWTLKNGSGIEMATESEQVGDGQSATWENQQNTPEAAVWTLEINIDAGGNSEDVNVTSELWTVYEEEESEPNPEPPSPE
ncbi:PKD domain-containing protein [Deltaproteobacteria bacterium]|nr:PKD domain-containing protein [Deltaproteobacteria bacterium]